MVCNGFSEIICLLNRGIPLVHASPGLDRMAQNPPQLQMRVSALISSLTLTCDFSSPFPCERFLGDPEHSSIRSVEWPVDLSPDVVVYVLSEKIVKSILLASPLRIFLATNSDMMGPILSATWDEIDATKFTLFCVSSPSTTLNQIFDLVRQFTYARSFIYPARSFIKLISLPR